MKKVLAITMSLAAMVSLTACGGGNSAPAATEAPAAGTQAEAGADTAAEGGEAAGSSSGDKYDLKLATNLAEDHVACQGYYAFADAVETATDGHVTVTVYSGEQLGKESDVTSAVSMGAKTCDIA